MNKNASEDDRSSPDAGDPELNDRTQSDGNSQHSEIESDADSLDDPAIRVGSPFAVDPIVVEPPKKIETLHDVGPIRYTAMGAVAASIMVLGFASAAAWWFPAGGALIAALGCVLSIFGMYSTYRFTSAGLLTLHLCLFVLSYGRSLG